MFQETGQQMMDENNPMARTDIKTDPEESNTTNEGQANSNGENYYYLYANN